ncbi:FAD-dependent oxidoreductase [Tsukamurella asaccharolytica]|uniref:FAD-dependent oxidoreductase n=1 Tax=Tsukamurella asaccharolytica TaxID=2592067 RepID=A0A5C5RA90_9ACTN|nr:FAD-dependent monooxygenase [Tsukamurella asaccharolytica]TWS19213.1 FAD-dependent oxidoreductase [Tsukamurella asaccharolytica]
MATTAIIGGGIGGLATAALLTQQGWAVDVFERAPSLPATGTALGMWPEAMAVLERVGAAKAVRAIGIDQRRAEIRSAGGHRLGPEVRAKGATVIISRPRLLESLAACAPAVRFGDRRPGISGLEHDVIVGADGIGSVVRAHVVGREVKPRPLGVDVLIGRCPGSTDTFTEYWGPGRLFGVTPRDGGYINWYSEFDPRAVPGGTPNPDEDPRGFLRAMYRGWDPRVAETIEGIETETALHYRSRDVPRLPRIVRGNIALLGDAAHAMAPNLGRGACETLLDAAALADALGAAADFDGDAAPALRVYESARRRAGQRTMLLSRAMRHVALTSRLRTPRDLLLRAAAALV